MNGERIWGAIHVLNVDAGITYYWGGDVEFGFGKYDAPEPTVSTFAVFSRMVASNPTTGRNLYMSLSASVNGLTDTEITANESRTAHTFTLDSMLAGKEDALIGVTFSASALTEAQEGFAVICDGTEYPLVWADPSKALDDPANADANATVAYDDRTKMASVSFTVSDAAYFGKLFRINTPNIADVKLYGMPRLPDLESISVSGNTATVVGDVEGLDGLVIYAIGVGGERYVIYDGTAGTDLPLTFPANMPGGSYTVTAVGSTADMTSNPAVSQENFLYENPNTPAAPTVHGAALGGDYTLDVTLTAPTGEFDGYLVTVYEVDENDVLTPTVYGDMLMDKTLTTPTAGGQYTTSMDAYTEEGSGETVIQEEVLTYGLEAGKTYKVGVRSYKEVAEGVYLPSEEILSGGVEMVEAVKPEVSMTAEGKVTLGGTDYVGKTDVTVQITGDESLRNLQYMLDDGGDINSSDDDWIALDGSTIPLTNLSEGGAQAASPR